eukprot:5014039-Pyramimonas_sp.AAC.1
MKVEDMQAFTKGIARAAPRPPFARGGRRVPLREYMVPLRVSMGSPAGIYVSLDIMCREAMGSPFGNLYKPFGLHTVAS